MDKILRIYRKGKAFGFCECGYEGEDFRIYDEAPTINDPDPMNEIFECPKCKHGNII